jgi:hypothetical protein
MSAKQDNYRERVEWAVKTLKAVPTGGSEMRWIKEADQFGPCAGRQCKCRTRKAKR